MYDVVIIGAGVAGLTAAIYATRAGKKVLVLESGVAGGQIVQAHDVRNWPGEQSISGETLTKNIFEQAKKLGAEFEYAEVMGVEEVAKDDAKMRVEDVVDDDAKMGVEEAADDNAKMGIEGIVNDDTKMGVEEVAKDNGKFFRVKTDDEEYTARAVIIATGSHDRALGLPEEEKYLGHGLSYCVTCDGALFKGKDVAVVGGGNMAFYDVLYLADLARRVYLVHRNERFRADATLVERVRKLQNVQILTNWTVAALEGEGELEKVKLRLNLEDAKEEEMEIEVAGLFVAIGREPATNAFTGLVEMNESGYIMADEDGATSRDGVFVAGDCRTKKVRQLVTAAADGATAATSAVEYLNL